MLMFVHSFLFEENSCDLLANLIACDISMYEFELKYHYSLPVV